MNVVTRWGIAKASARWSLRRQKMFDPEEIYECDADAIWQVGSVWCVNRGWLDRIKTEKYAAVSEELAAGRWEEDKPLCVGFGSNGFVTLLDGNHRLTFILSNDLVSHYPRFPVRFHFFNVGDVINPFAPNHRWDGKNLAFICYPRGSCGKCSTCRHTLPEIKSLLRRNGLE